MSMGRTWTPEERLMLSKAMKGIKKSYVPPKSAATREKIRQSKLGKHRPDMKGKNNWNWKGDNAGYFALHSWVERRLGKPQQCEDCKTTIAKRFEWANISGAYKREISDWKRLCPPCHHKLDDIATRGWKTRKEALFA